MILICGDKRLRLQSTITALSHVEVVINQRRRCLE